MCNFLEQETVEYGWCSTVDVPRMGTLSQERLDTILLQGHAVTLNFKVVTKILGATRRLSMVIISVKKF